MVLKKHMKIKIRKQWALKVYENKNRWIRDMKEIWKVKIVYILKWKK